MAEQRRGIVCTGMVRTRSRKKVVPVACDQEGNIVTEEVDLDDLAITRHERAQWVRFWASLGAALLLAGAVTWLLWRVGSALYEIANKIQMK